MAHCLSRAALNEITWVREATTDAEWQAPCSLAWDWVDEVMDDD